MRSSGSKSAHIAWIERNFGLIFARGGRFIEMESPVPFDEVHDEELKSKFSRLISGIRELGFLRSNIPTIMSAFYFRRFTTQEQYEALIERIRGETANDPSLSRIIDAVSVEDDSIEEEYDTDEVEEEYDTDEVEEDDDIDEVEEVEENHTFSLLSVVCDYLHREWIHPAIKLLIESNPSALLWRGTHDATTPLHTIARHGSHCVLMPWIAQHYTWVLDHERSLDIQSQPPALGLLQQYSSGNPLCTTETIRSFFETYPSGLRQVNLHTFAGTFTSSILNQWKGGRCDADLFIWMVQQHPESMLERDQSGRTPFNKMCQNHRFSNDDLREICTFLIDEYPEVVRSADNRGVLPIHGFVGRCHHRSMLDTALLLLKAHPESFHQGIPRYPAPSSNTFIRHAYLQESQAAFQEAVTCTQDGLIKAVSDIFSNWASSRLKVMEVEMKEDEVFLLYKETYEKTLGLERSRNSIL